MAKLFLSYSRKDAARAERFTDWLEAEGHDVWRDEDDIGGGASFSSEIEQALNGCNAVIVLWSAESVKSAWVRDEAGYGRDAGKLIPFTLDGTEPPLGFRQFQLIDLSRWKGRGEPADAERIRRAIARVAGASAGAAPAKPAPASRQRAALFGRPLLVGGAVAAIAAVVLLVIVWQSWSNERQIAIAVLPSPQSPDRSMAADYANVAVADMASFLPRRFDRAMVIAPADAGASGSAYRMQISTSPHGAGVDASLTLSDLDGRTTLWSQNWSVTDAAAADLKAQVSAAASKAALCLTDARGGSPRLTQPALGLYLTGCTGLGDTKLSDVDFTDIFERVTKLEPKFASGWAYLALSEVNGAQAQQNASPAAREAGLERARQAIAAALRLNPNSAQAYHAEYHLVSRDQPRAFKFLGKAIELAPNDGLLQMHLSDQLFLVGRISDSIQASQRAVELDPGSPYVRSQYISTLAFAGAIPKARAEIAEARKRWPSDPQIDIAEFTVEYRYGDANAALKLLPKITDSSEASMAPLRKVIAARRDPSPSKIDQAIAALSAQSANEPDYRNAVVRTLGNLGRVDQVYQLLEDPTFQPDIDRGALFRAGFAAVRADPRFMQVAARLGLVRYWRETGSWPDFCATERLPYDCKKEAAKYR
jgi:hypothetical protein